jgi:hypothetical protein
VDDREYGWNEFICRSRKAKFEYFMMAIRESIPYNTYEFEKERLLEQVYIYFKDLFKEFHIQKSAFCDSDRDSGEFSGYIDHQSQINCPLYPDGKFALDFFSSLILPIIYNDGVAIVGGNDNSECSLSGTLGSPYQDNLEVLNILSDRGELKIRKEEFGWVLFSPGWGNKWYLSDNKVPLSKVDFPKNYMPELLDINITDFCDKGCSFCYRGCTESGKHADSYQLNMMIETFSKLGVFELALGGGETLCYPGLLPLLKRVKEHKMIANITTADIRSLRYVSFWNQLMEDTGGIGLSVSSMDDFELLKRTVEQFWGKHTHLSLRLTLHLIVGGPLTEENLHEVIAYAGVSHFDILLLGFKHSGRGEKHKEWTLSSGFLKKVKEDNQYLSLAADTVFVVNYENMMRDSGVDEKLYYKHEGVVSKYIDAVSMKIGKSSYDEKTFKDFQMTKYSKDNYLAIEQLKE